MNLPQPTNFSYSSLVNEIEKRRNKNTTVSKRVCVGLENVC
jgi:hypothetical protein